MKFSIYLNRLVIVMSSKDPDQPVHFFTGYMIAKDEKCFHADNEDSDQTAQMRG